MKTATKTKTKTSTRRAPKKNTARVFDFVISLNDSLDFNQVDRQIVAAKLNNNIPLRTDEVRFIIDNIVDYTWNRFTIYPNNVAVFAYKANELNQFVPIIINANINSLSTKTKKQNAFKRMWNKLFKKNK